MNHTCIKLLNPHAPTLWKKRSFGHSALLYMCLVPMHYFVTEVLPLAESYVHLDKYYFYKTAKNGNRNLTHIILSQGDLLN